MEQCVVMFRDRSDFGTFFVEIFCRVVGFLVVGGVVGFFVVRRGVGERCCPDEVSIINVTIFWARFDHVSHKRDTSSIGYKSITLVSGFARRGFRFDSWR
uniref:Transmembrane protein n=1 Tax=Cacopsylla melanoneura TaxID=428564 RepID=A0A8D8X0M0_9HEMI